MVAVAEDVEQRRVDAGQVVRSGTTISVPRPEARASRGGPAASRWPVRPPRPRGGRRRRPGGRGPGAGRGPGVGGDVVVGLGGRLGLGVARGTASRSTSARLRRSARPRRRQGRRSRAGGPAGPTTRRSGARRPGWVGLAARATTYPLTSDLHPCSRDRKCGVLGRHEVVEGRSWRVQFDEHARDRVGRRRLRRPCGRRGPWPCSSATAAGDRQHVGLIGDGRCLPDCALTPEVSSES